MASCFKKPLAHTGDHRPMASCCAACLSCRRVRQTAGVSAPSRSAGMARRCCPSPPSASCAASMASSLPCSLHACVDRECVCIDIISCVVRDFHPLLNHTTRCTQATYAAPGLPSLRSPATDGRGARGAARARTPAAHLSTVCTSRAASELAQLARRWSVLGRSRLATLARSGLGNAGAT